MITVSFIPLKYNKYEKNYIFYNCVDSFNSISEL